MLAALRTLFQHAGGIGELPLANLGHTCFALNGYSQSSVNADRFLERRGVRRRDTAGCAGVDGAESPSARSSSIDMVTFRSARTVCNNRRGLACSAVRMAQSVPVRPPTAFCPRHRDQHLLRACLDANSALAVEHLPTQQARRVSCVARAQ